MSNFFEKLFGKKKKENVSNNQNTTQPEQAITFNQNMNVENPTINPLGFQPTSPIENIQNNQSVQEAVSQPIEFNNQPMQQQVPVMNNATQQELNVISEPQTIQNPTPIEPLSVMPSTEASNAPNPQPITFNQELPPQQPQQGTLNVIPTLGPTPNPTITNQDNINNQNM